MMEIQSNLFDLGYDAYTDYEKAKNEFLCDYMDANKTVLEYLYHSIQTDNAKLDALLFWTQKAIDKDNTIYKIWDNPIVSIIEPSRAGEPTIINIVNDSESISSVYYTILGPHHYYEDDCYLCGGDSNNIEYTFSTTLRYPGEYSILVSVNPNTPQERFAMADFVVPGNLAPLDYIPNQRYGGEMIEIECYYNPMQGYTYSDRYMDENWVWHDSESTTRHIIKHTFENLDLTLYELPERPCNCLYRSWLQGSERR